MLGREAVIIERIERTVNPCSRLGYRMKFGEIPSERRDVRHTFAVEIDAGPE